MSNDKMVSIFDPMKNAYRDVPVSMARKFIENIDRVKKQIKEIEKYEKDEKDFEDFKKSKKQKDE